MVPGQPLLGRHFDAIPWIPSTGWRPTCRPPDVPNLWGIGRADISAADQPQRPSGLAARGRAEHRLWPLLIRSCNTSSGPPATAHPAHNGPGPGWGNRHRSGGAAVAPLLSHARPFRAEPDRPGRQLQLGLICGDELTGDRNTPGTDPGLCRAAFDHLLAPTVIPGMVRTAPARRPGRQRSPASGLSGVPNQRLRNRKGEEDVIRQSGLYIRRRLRGRRGNGMGQDVRPAPVGQPALRPNCFDADQPGPGGDGRPPGFEQRYHPPHRARGTCSTASILPTWDSGRMDCNS